MREIKFRAWDKKLKHLYYGVETFFEGTWDRSVWPPRGYVYPTGVNETFKDFLNNEDQVLMQFTGLYDKNGKEIYEGDIIHACSEERFDKGIGSVYFKNGNYRILWKLKGKHSLLGYTDRFRSTNRLYIEIIGNIYENPELLNNLKEVTQ